MSTARCPQIGLPAPAAKLKLDIQSTRDSIELSVGAAPLDAVDRRAVKKRGLIS